ncbi:MAG: cardiolipin synthase, partial [Lachnospiraceae bacterium]
PSYKLVWMIPILLIPVFGTLFYLYMELQPSSLLIRKRIRDVERESNSYLTQDEETLKELALCDGEYNLASYLQRQSSFPVYKCAEARFFPLGEDKFLELKKQLEAAKSFIFMEYFIIERGEMWDSILEILERKVKEGVEVRVMYDGMCSLVLLPYKYPERLKKMGIRCKMFSPIKPALSSYQNNRDHRKIVVIDGHTAFTGGVNLADEYINKKMRFGHWKDTAVMIKGEAVKSFTIMFLQLWNASERGSEDYARYIKTQPFSCEQEGYVIPYGDSPMDHETVGEYVYLDILYRAKKYVHIMTPYLILDNDMLRALAYSAKRGVETIIIMPHIPDKVYAYLVARSYYPELIRAGVQIYEYTPGFIHAKEFISDDEKAVVGTINLDYRSLYLHFECAAYFFRTPVIKDVEKDFQDTLAKCHKITLEECWKYPVLKKFAGRVMRLFAPLM